MSYRQVMVLLCSLLAWQPSVSANAIQHQNESESSNRSSHDRIRSGGDKAVIDAHRDSKEKAELNPLKSNPGLQNISLTEINVSRQSPSESALAQGSADSTEIADTSSKTDDKGKHDKRKSSKTWKQKLKEASTGEIPENVSEAAKHCSSTMAKYWNTWTQGSGVLTIKRIGQLLNDSDITGKQAAALGALADYFYRENRKVSSLKTADKKDSYTLTEIQSALADLTVKRTNEALADDYRTALIQIKDDTTKDGYSLYGKLGSPRFGENVQWNVCDCYFVSAVNAVLQHDPSAIENMITAKPPDTFEVRFPGYKDGKTPVTVHLTQGDIAMFSHTKDGGCYLAVLGRAADEVMRLEHDDHSSAGNATPLGTMVDQGSHWDETNTFHLLTGQNFTQIKTTQYTTEELKKLIEYAQDHNEIIGLGEAYSPISKHYLLVTGFKDGELDVLNPWGQTRYYTPLGNDPLPFLPDMVKPDSGHVFAMHNGHFKVPLKDLVKWGFGSLTIQRQDLQAVLGPDSDKNSGSDSKLLSTAKADDPTTTQEQDTNTDGASTAGTDTAGTDTAESKTDEPKSDAKLTEKKDGKQVHAPLTDEAAKREFDRTVQKYWDKWTASSDGKLNIKEIGALLRNPAITGKEAALLGTLAITLTHDLINKEHKPLAAFTEAQVLSNTKETHAIKYFKDAMEQIQGDSSSKGLSLYGSTGHPDWKKVKQWKVGDCWFVSVVDAILRANGASYIENMIRQDPEDHNKFTVSFPGHKDKIDVTLTEGEIAMFSHTIKDGSWLAVLGMALNTVMEDRHKQEKKADGYRSWYPFGHVINGGNNLLTYKLFTKNTYTRIPTSNIEEVKAALKWAEEHNLPIGINTHKHDLSIKDIDWKEGKVEIQNPWGTEQKYSTDVTFKMGPDGTFWVPIDELYKDNFIKIEVPLEAKTAAQANADQSKNENGGTSPSTPQISKSEDSPEEIANSSDDKNIEPSESDSVNSQSQQISKVIRLNQGSAFIANQNALKIQANNASINLPADAIAFVVSLNGSTVVYNLANKNPVTVDPGTGDSLFVNSGHALLISNNSQATADKINPLRNVPLSNTRPLGLFNKSSCFDAEFSYTAVMDNAPQIATVFQSNAPENKQLVNLLLKRAAAGKMAGE